MWWKPLFLLAVAMVGAHALLSAQAPLVDLATPLGLPAEEFTTITGVVELRGGKVLVVDATERRLVLFEPRGWRPSSIGRVGAGPREFRSIGDFLLRRPDGGAYVVDFAQRRLLPVTPEGTLSDVVGSPVRQVLWRTADGRGRLYGDVMMFSATRRLSDSMRITRWDPRTGVVDTLLTYDAGRSAMVTRQGEPRRVFTASATWNVLDDGSIAILEAEPYRLSIWRDHRRVATHVLPFDPLAVTEADRTAWIAEQEGRTTRVLGRGGAPSGGPPPRWQDGGLDFPERFPAFEVDTPLLLAPGSRLWIRRLGHVGAPRVLYDVITRDGKLLAHVRMPPGGTVVGVGADVIYLAVRDADDIVRFRVFPMPSALR